MQTAGKVPAMLLADLFEPALNALLCFLHVVFRGGGQKGMVLPRLLLLPSVVFFCVCMSHITRHFVTYWTSSFPSECAQFGRIRTMLLSAICVSWP
jgi:hypothetical protein